MYCVLLSGVLWNHILLLTYVATFQGKLGAVRGTSVTRPSCHHNGTPMETWIVTKPAKNEAQRALASGSHLECDASL
ncbi:hypothetical protein F4780DRAFT_745438 [Xylariomycetidae sp. FL0641]|nr:hypothetical protein F4780DRAFT_745438 [Xylariomycetidae sp. FL0641]